MVNDLISPPDVIKALSGEAKRAFRSMHWVGGVPGEGMEVAPTPILPYALNRPIGVAEMMECFSFALGPHTLRNAKHHARRTSKQP